MGWFQATFGVRHDTSNFERSSCRPVDELSSDLSRSFQRRVARSPRTASYFRGLGPLPECNYDMLQDSCRDKLRAVLHVFSRSTAYGVLDCFPRFLRPHKAYPVPCMGNFMLKSPARRRKYDDMSRIPALPACLSV